MKCKEEREEERERVSFILSRAGQSVWCRHGEVHARRGVVMLLVGLLSGSVVSDGSTSYETFHHRGPTQQVVSCICSRTSRSDQARGTFEPSRWTRSRLGGKLNVRASGSGVSGNEMSLTVRTTSYQSYSVVSLSYSVFRPLCSPTESFELASYSASGRGAGRLRALLLLDRTILDEP